MSTVVHWSDPATHEAGDIEVPDELYDDDSRIDAGRIVNDDDDRLVEWQRYLSTEANRRELLTAIANLAAVGGAPAGQAPAQARAAAEYSSVAVTHVRVEVKKRSVYAGVSQAAQAAQPVEYYIPRAQFEQGPPRARGFDGLSDQQKLDTWAKHLETNELPKVQVYGSTSLVVGLDADTVAVVDPNAPKQPGEQFDVENEADRTSGCCAPWTKGKSAGLAALVLLILAGIEESLRNTVGSNPTGVGAEVTPGTGTSTVTVRWSPPPMGSVRSYQVALTGGAGDPKVLDVAAEMTSTQFIAVADGQYSVTVTAFCSGAANGSASTSVSVAAASKLTPALTAPADPTGVKATVSNAIDGSGKGLTITWTPGTGGGAVESFLVSVTETSTKAVLPTIDAKLMTSAFVPVSADGNYVATVTAKNAAGSSKAVAAAAVSVTLMAGQPPNPPADLRAAVFTSAGAAGVVVAWNEPATGTPPTTYMVSVSGGPTAFVDRISTTKMTTFTPLADGTYTFTVVAKTGTLTSTAVSSTVSVKSAALPPESVDWAALFTDTTEQSWRALQDTVGSTAEPAFWSQVIDTLADPSQQYGGPATFVEQLAMARFLLTLFTRPLNTANSDTQAVTLSGRLCRENPANEQPFVAFPTSKPAPGAEWSGDPLVLWRRATVIKSQMGATLAIRTRLQALDRALSLYLGLPPADLVVGQ